MLAPAKVVKDVRELADIVILQEIRDTGISIQQLQQKLQVLQTEANRRIAENQKKNGTEIPNDGGKPAPTIGKGKSPSAPKK